MEVEWLADDTRIEPPSLRRAWLVPMLLASAACLGLIAAAAGLGGYYLGRHTVASPRTIQVQGLVIIADAYTWVGNDANGLCTAEDRRADVQTAAPVLVLDAQLHVLGGAELSSGRPHPQGCEFTFTATVLRTSGPYLVKVANEEQQAFTIDEIAHPVITLH
jgi:hypothetical protein